MARGKPATKTPKERTAGEQRLHQERRLDAEIEESFPASDPPSYAGGPHAVGGPERPKRRKASP